MYRLTAKCQTSTKQMISYYTTPDKTTCFNKAGKMLMFVDLFL